MEMLEDYIISMKSNAKDPTIDMIESKTGL
jgi:hypothetical protein